jgi:uracil-DNA glycosylase
LDNCRDQIDQTIHILKPKLILSLGNHAAKRFGFRGSMGAIHGTNRAYKTSRVYCCTHPAALYRTETEKARARVELDIETDLKLALHFFKS